MSATVRLHRLTMVAEDDGVMIGRPDTGSYAVFPEEGAQALRMFGDGARVDEVAAWYERAYGAPLDMDDFLETLADLGFLHTGEPVPEAGRVRWQRLGQLVFSWPAWCAYGVVVAVAVTVMVRDPGLRPSYHQVFFTHYLSLIPLTVFALAIPCIVIHEGAHALAGRRLGLPSTLGIGRRLYYLVAETRLDSLLSVERRKRYLPFCAGMLADVVLLCGLTLLSLAIEDFGFPSWVHKLCLAVAFTCLLRIIWQFLFYLETDLYYVVTTAARCTDLQNATRFRIRGGVRRALRRPAPDVEGSAFSERDRAVARWYAPLLIAGYGFSLASLAWAGLPTAVHFWSTIADRLGGGDTPLWDLFDAAVFIALSGLQIGLLVHVTLRDRRARRAPGAPAHPSTPVPQGDLS
ncbi:hypothetical protein GTY65_04880 [Streptomyces sp. SID8379]|uniref:hypothetical protein n=1 Tax=unclassified Streptomyces TaxID=2593676 RepID=UPI0003A61A54|nr:MULTISPECIES: hypothetical protein [unclassified Streptomyces]MYW63414.1 hypothetical protein [Streptomyces sp. SID8379]